MNLISSSIINNEDYHQITLNNYKCNQCLKIFTSKYGYNSHINMSHSNQSIVCSNCNLTFRSYRTLKNHQQRFHMISSERIFPNYQHISSYFMLPFSTQQFSLITTNASELNYFPLGELTSKIFQCQFCLLSFPSLNSLKYHQLNQHEQYEYEICQTILYEIIFKIEENFLEIIDKNDHEFLSIKYLLEKQAKHFQLKNKQLTKKIHLLKNENNRLIFPKCEHKNRTCANLCLEYLSSYNKLIENYPYKILTTPKGNPFAQGSIVSISMISKENRMSSIQMKRKFSLHTETKSSDLISSKKVNHTYTRSLSSMSSNSSTSTRSSRQSTIPSLKRSISPTITLAVERSSEKRRRQREQRKTENFSSNSIQISNNIEQENDDDIKSNKSKKSKERQGSNSSVEYVQIINNDQQSISSLNNIENYNEDIILCHSPSPTTTLSPIKKVHSKEIVRKTSEYNENIRVRCKICGDILEGRSRFSKHVLTMHSHLLKTNLSDIKQSQQKTTMVYSV